MERKVIQFKLIDNNEIWNVGKENVQLNKIICCLLLVVVLW